jgi:beta-lactamase superfamily II metal-dependent hydrolase
VGSLAPGLKARGLPRATVGLWKGVAMALERRFVNDCGGKFKVALKATKEGGATRKYLLWGDHVRIVGTSGSMVEVLVRDDRGWLPQAVLGDEGLLELYVIDVGQGDGILMRTPNDKWHVIDAGIENEMQMTKKGLANFVRWKFMEDLGKQKVRLENLILSHPDYDHYGGMIDLLKGKVQRPDREFTVEVENFYHPGIGRFASTPRIGRIKSGTVPEPPFDEYGINGTDDFITELLDGKASFASPSRPLDDAFSRFAALVATVPSQVRRIDHTDEYLPGYEAHRDVSIRILGPVLEAVDGVPGLRTLGGDAITTNGHSVVLRVDYGKARMLLTGDLNTVSQRLLLSYHALDEFAVDVAKGCHHGADDIDLRFVRAMKARTTVISSGDNEDYAHPRPRVLGASSRYGRESKAVDGELLPPLLYSTELARSVRLAYAARVRKTGTTGADIKAEDGEIKADVANARFERLDQTPLSLDLVYGLINIRTDGERIMCAYLEEQGKDFDVKAFKAGVEPPL